MGIEMARPKSEQATQQVSVRIDASLVELADRVADGLGRVNVGGMRYTRVDALRAAIERGLREIDAEVSAKLAAGCDRKPTARSTARRRSPSRQDLSK